MIIERIGTAAMLEQTAEEAAELTQACLKAARCKRGENPVYKTRAQIQSDLAEEIADVIICIRELLSQNTDLDYLVNKMQGEKIERTVKRIREEDRSNEHKSEVREMPGADQTDYWSLGWEEWFSWRFVHVQ